MRKIVVTMWESLDGLIAGPNGELDWVTRIFSPEMGAYEDELVNNAGALMFGRLTYQGFAGSWPTVPDNPEVSENEKAYARKLNVLPKIVFSRTLEKAGWSSSTLLREINPAEINKLKQQPGKDILIYGSASIVQALTNLSLVDEYQLLIHPVILGRGKPLFQNIQSQVNLDLLQTRNYPAGVVLAVYRPAERNGP